MPKNIQKLIDKSQKYIYLTEILIGFLILYVLNYVFFRDHLGFIGFKFHPYWIVILIFSARYGLAAGFASGFLGALLYVYFFFGAFPSFSQLEQLAETQDILTPVMFLIVGTILGSVSQKAIHTIGVKVQDIKKKEEELKKVKDFADASEKARRVLESRIVGETTTIKTLYQSAVRLNISDPNEVYKGFLDILNEHFNVERASFYLKEGDYFILQAAHGWKQQEKVEGKVFIDKSLMKVPFDENKRIIVQEFLKRPDVQQFSDQFGQILASFPVRNADYQPIGLVNIETMDFLSFHHANLELIELMVEWVSKALQEITLFDQMNAQHIYDDRYGIFNHNHFLLRIEEEFLRAKEAGFHLSVGLLKIDRFGFFSDENKLYLAKTLTAIMKNKFRKIDKIFSHSLEGVFLVIAPLQAAHEMESCVKSIQMEFEDVFKDKKVEGNVVHVQMKINEWDVNMKDSTELLNPLFSRD